MKPLALPAALLALVLLGGPAPAPAVAQTGPLCLFDQATVPSPADGTVVLAARTSVPKPANPDGFDVQIFLANDLLQGFACGGYDRVLEHPSAIAVGRGAAVMFYDSARHLYSNWGAVSVDASGPAPVLFPGRPDFIGDYVYVADPLTFFNWTGSCRDCVLSDTTLNFGSPSVVGPSVAYQLDLSNANLSGAQGLEGANLSHANLSGAIMDPTYLNGANLSGATLSTHLEHAIGLGTAILDGADFSGATLNGVDLSGAQLNHPTVNGTVFDGANLVGSQLVDLQFQTPPSFNGVSVGQSSGGPCTAFQDSDLHNVSLTLAQTTPGCETSPLLPGSTVSVGFIASLYGKPGLAAGSVANVDLGKAYFLADASDRSSLAGLDLDGINLSGASFVGWPVDLSGTKLEDAMLQGTSFQQAELAGAKFKDAQAAGAVFRGAHLAASATQPAANFGGSQTNLEGADFIEADVSGVSFSSADLSADASGKQTSFDRALAVGTDFTGVRAVRASFNGAHIYGNAEAFDTARDLSQVDFTDALLASDISEGSRFNFTNAPLAGAHFDGAQCINCDFTEATFYDQQHGSATFVGAYLPGAVFSNAVLHGVDLDNAWLYCGDKQNSACTIDSAAARASARDAHPSPTTIPKSTSVPAHDFGTPGASVNGDPKLVPTAQASPPPGTMWDWTLDLGSNEAYGPVPFTTTDLTSAVLTGVAYCPDGNPPAPSFGCNNAMLPTSWSGLPIPCSTTAGQPAGRGAVASEACSTTTATIFDVKSVGRPLAVVAATPPGWATPLTGPGYYVGLDDGTVRQVGAGDPQVVAGQAGQHCDSAPAACGDGGPATSALLGAPTGLAVGPDGALYVADPILHRVRRIDANDQTITTVAGSGQACNPPEAACGDGGPATAADLGGPDGVWIDPSGILWIADDRRGLREVGADGTISSIGVTPGAYTLRSVAGDGTGNLYVVANDPDYLLMVTPPTPPVTPVVCQQLALAPGTLIQATGNDAIAVVDRGCQRRHVPDDATLVQIEQDYHVSVMSLSEANWQSIPAGPAIPESSNLVSFTQAMWQIFQPVCARLVLAPNDLIQDQASGQEVDIVDRNCQRHKVPDPATVELIQQTYQVGLYPVPDTDFQEIAAGNAIPSATTNLAGYAQSMWAMFQLVCSRLATGPIAPGTLILTDGNPEIDILNPGCQRQHVPDVATLAQIRQTFNVGTTPLTGDDWQAIATGPAIPSVSTDQPGFARAMEPMFGSPCTAQNLFSGYLLSTPGNPEIDIVEDSEAASCQRRHVPNPGTLQQIQQTYNPATGQADGLSWQRIPAGPEIPDIYQDAYDYDIQMGDIFGVNDATRATSVPTRPAAVTAGGGATRAMNVLGQATPVVGTGTSGYNGTIDGLCNLLPGTQVQLDHPTGLSVRADGDVLFADTGNNIVRAYNPAYGHVVDLAGLIETNPDDCPVQGTPPGGFNQDGQWANQTELNAPQSVTATGEAVSLFVVADTGNGRIRLLGPSPLVTSAAAPPAPTSDTLMPTPSPSPTATSTTNPEATPAATQTATPTPSTTPTATATSTVSPSPTNHRHRIALPRPAPSLRPPLRRGRRCRPTRLPRLPPGPRGHDRTQAASRGHGADNEVRHGLASRRLLQDAGVADASPGLPGS
jgi:uncharacterized protein YjbI with pentapeptide repeats